ncbi:hypothetical protein [Arcticibacterium luteifluviistationis]|nr:hypothetical protein [Arcticibacterium luteifluviistationis]
MKTISLLCLFSFSIYFQVFGQTSVSENDTIPVPISEVIDSDSLTAKDDGWGDQNKGKNNLSLKNQADRLVPLPTFATGEEKINLRNGTYAFKYNVKSSQSLLKSEDLDKGKLPEINRGNKIEVFYSTANEVCYQYIPFIDSNEMSVFNNKTICVPTEIFDQITEPIYSINKGVKVGTYTVPFRLRNKADNFDFESSLSLSANFVWGLGKPNSQEALFELSAGIGITSANLDSLNSDVSENRTATAFTTSLGLVFRPNSVANIGLFIGNDYLNQRDKETKWIFNKERWVGLGININLDAITTDNKSTKSKQSGND